MPSDKEISQAQVASGTISLQGQCPSRGYRLRDFTLNSADGKDIHLSDYRGRSNLVLVFAGRAGSASNLLAEIGQHCSQLQGEDAQALAIVQDATDAVVHLAQKLALSFPLLIDEDGRIHREFGATADEGTAAPAVYITDRYGEVFASYRTAVGQALPNVQEILTWLSFVNSQCPECEPPEWPP